MRKNISLILSLLIIPFSLSCNNGGGDNPKIVTEVTEEEFYKAIKLEDIEYAQALYEAPPSSNSMRYISYEFSPTIYLEKEMESPTSTTYGGILVKKENDKYFKYSCDPETGAWDTDPKDAEESDFKKPNFLYETYLESIFFYAKFTYGTFAYNDEAKTYCASKLLEGTSIELSLKFENKKLISFINKTIPDSNSAPITYTTTLNITYEEKTPDMPF